MKNLDIISIGGMDGIGKTSQVSMLYNYFNNLGVPVIVNRVKLELESELKHTSITWKFLSKNPNGVVINDGSIATMMQIDIQNNMPQEEVGEKYKDILHEYELLNHKYGMINILLAIDDIEICKERVIKKRRILRIDNYKDIDFNYTEQTTMSSGLKMFDSYIVSKSLKFHTLNTNFSYSITDVHEDVIKIINERFTIKSP